MGPPNRIMRPDSFASELDDLERRIRALETAPSLQDSAIKEGATTILDASGVRRVIVGKAPDGTYGLEVFAADGTTPRVIVGRSPGFFEVYAADGVTKILDAAGLTAVVKELVTVSYIQGSTTTSTTETSIPTNGSAVASFTLATAASVLILSKFTAKTSGASGFFAYTQITLTGQASHGQGLWDKGVGGYSGEAYYVVYPLPVGDFTASMTCGSTLGRPSPPTAAS